MIYHKTINFPHEKLLNMFVAVTNARFKSKDIIFTTHAKNRLLERITDLKELYSFYMNVKINFDDVIEYTFFDNIIHKILVRLPYNQYDDIILSISDCGKIITLYFNKKDDMHKTLNSKVYAEK
jgi:hypothetical protein